MPKQTCGNELMLSKTVHYEAGQPTFMLELILVYFINNNKDPTLYQSSEDKVYGSAPSLSAIKYFVFYNINCSRNIDVCPWKYDCNLINSLFLRL